MSSRSRNMAFRETIRVKSRCCRYSKQQSESLETAKWSPSSPKISLYVTPRRTGTQLTRMPFPY